MRTCLYIGTLPCIQLGYSWNNNLKDPKITIQQSNKLYYLPKSYIFDKQKPFSFSSGAAGGYLVWQTKKDGLEEQLEVTAVGTGCHLLS